MSEPVRLSVVVPYRGEDQPPYRLSDPEGYVAPNLFPATMVLHRPVEQMAQMLILEGSPPTDRFAIMNERGEILFAGEIGKYIQ